MGARGDADKPGICNGAGLLIVIPSYAFTQALPLLLEALRCTLAPEGRRDELTADWLGK